MDESIKEKYIIAGKVSSQALELGVSLVKKGVTYREVADKIEEYILNNNCQIAFPVNISANYIAAHDTAFPGDERVFNDEILKIDVGAHYDGYVGDNAATVDLSGQNTELVNASRNALNTVLKIVRPGVTLAEIGKTIQESIQSEGFEPIKNLSGHGVDRFQIHCGHSIPNYDCKSEIQLKEDQTIAIEPFATNGEGFIHEVGAPGIFRNLNKRISRNPITRNVAKEIAQYNTLPFASRWLQKKLSVSQINFGLRDLVKLGAIESYSPLVEKTKGFVSQAEHTMIVREKPIILTKGNL